MRSPFVVFSALALGACLELPPMAAGVCGNGVVDAGEDCDGFVAYAGARCEAPGRTAACRFACGPGDCPPGWGCGVDGVCRAPSGAFRAGGGHIDGLSEGVATGDFDGDGRDELVVRGTEDALGRSSVELLYLDAEGSLSSNLPIVSLAAGPVVASLTRDGTDDLAFVDVGGMAVLRGVRGLRGLSAQPYPTRLFAGAQRVRLVSSGDGASRADRLVAFVETEPGHVAVRWLDEDDAAPPVAELEGGLDGLAAGPFRLPARGVEAGPGGAPCSTLLIGFRGRRELRLVTPCRALGGAPAPAPRALRLPAGAALGARVLVGELDGDGRADLLIAGAAGESYAAYGAADGTFRPAPGGEGEADLAGPYAVPTLEEVGMLPPLAFGDLNLDGRPDFVLADGVLLSRAGGGYEVAARKVGGRWSEALVGRFNGDAYPDVVAATSGGLGLDFYINATDPDSGRTLLNPRTVPTRGLPALLTAADLDGDLLVDVAFIEHFAAEEAFVPADDAPAAALAHADDEADGASHDTLAVSFGRTTGAPLAPLRFGSFYQVEQIVAGLLSERFEYGDLDGEAEPDGIYDLAVAYRAEGATADYVTEMRGRGDRELRAYLELRRGEGEVDFPLALAAGRFFGDGLDMAVLAIDRDGALRLWGVPEAAELGDEGLLVGTPLPLGMGPCVTPATGEVRQWAPMAAGDLDGDGRDELVLAMPAGAGAAFAIVRAFGEGGPGGGGRFEADAFALDAALGHDARLSLGDFDGDGALDVALLPALGASEALVFWNRGGGTFDPGDVARLRARDDHFVGMAAISSAGGPGHDLVLVEHATAFRTLRGGGAPRSLAAAPLAGVVGGGAAAGGDFDGDGVTDLAVAGAGVRVYFGEPVLR